MSEPSNQAEVTVDKRATALLAEQRCDDEALKKTRGRPFQPGNPGRPPGSKNRTTRLLEQLVADDAEKVTRKFIEMALAGNTKCMQMYMDRLMPKRNGRPVDFSLPPVNNAKDAVAAMAAIASAVNEGNLTADEAGQMAYFISGYTKVLEIYDLNARLEALEAKMEKRQ